MSTPASPPPPRTPGPSALSASTPSASSSAASGTPASGPTSSTPSSRTCRPARRGVGGRLCHHQPARGGGGSSRLGRLRRQGLPQGRGLLVVLPLAAPSDPRPLRLRLLLRQCRCPRRPSPRRPPRASASAPPAAGSGRAGRSHFKTPNMFSKANKKESKRNCIYLFQICAQCSYSMRCVSSCFRFRVLLAS